MEIEHVALYVNDLEAARDFFVKYFEAKSGEKYNNFNTGFSCYFLTFKSGSRLEIMNRSNMDNLPKGTYRTEVFITSPLPSMMKKLYKNLPTAFQMMAITSLRDLVELATSITKALLLTLKVMKLKSLPSLNKAR